MRWIVPPYTEPHPPIHAINIIDSNRAPRPGTKSVLCDMEPHPVPATAYDLIITTKQDVARSRPNAIYVPAWSYMLAELSKFSVHDLLRRPKCPKPKKRFCAFMYSNCNSSTFSGVAARQRFFDLLNQRKRVHAIGKCKNNLSATERAEEQVSSREKGDWDATIRDLYPYKFVIAFENVTDLAGYVTEKMTHPLLAGCIPIYLGHAATVDEQFNPACFIHVAKYPSFEACIDHVLRVDQDDKLYQSYVTAPIITPEKLSRYASWYYGTQTFYQPFFAAFPLLKHQAYSPLQTGYRSDPSKPIKVINLDRSVERWANMRAQLDKYPFLTYERFPAIEGKKYYDAYRSLMSSTNPLNPGELGIYLSTMEVLYALTQDEQNEYYMLLEDDVILSSSIKPIEQYVRDAPPSWDVLYLDANIELCNEFRNKAKRDYEQMDRECMPGNYAVIFRKRAAHYYLKFAFPILFQIDMFPQACANRLNYYLLNPKSSPVQPNYDNASTIELTPGTRASTTEEMRTRSRELLVTT